MCALMQSKETLHLSFLNKMYSSNIILKAKTNIKMPNLIAFNLLILSALVVGLSFNMSIITSYFLALHKDRTDALSGHKSLLLSRHLSPWHKSRGTSLVLAEYYMCLFLRFRFLCYYAKRFCFYCRTVSNKNHVYVFL